MNLSKYITLAEAIKSDTAIKNDIDNTPNPEQLANMKYVAENVFDKVREHVNGPLAATSFFRSKVLNTLIGGSSATSQHMLGEAIDIDCDKFGNGTNKEIFDYIVKNLPFDQIINEYPDKDGNPSWVHVSLKRIGKNRKEQLVKLKNKYIPVSQYKIGMI